MTQANAPASHKYLSQRTTWRLIGSLFSCEMLAQTSTHVNVHPSSEIVVYPTISEIVYQNIALYQMGRLEITKMVEE